MSQNFFIKFLEDINHGYENALNYPTIDRKTQAVFLGHLLFLLFYTFLNSVVKIANYFQSPFSWRVITYQEAVRVLIIGFVITLLPLSLNKFFSVHYNYRLLITLCLVIFSYLYIFLSGGAIEAHFHFFIVIGYLAIYSDWRLGWVALAIIAFNHLLLEFLAPSWLFYYGKNWLSPLAHIGPIWIATIFMGILANTNRQVLLVQSELERRKDEFISMASHELKTPVTSIIMFVEYVQRSLRKEKISTYDTSFKRINEQLKKLSTLISDLLDVSRIQGKELQYSYQRVDLNKLIETTVDTVQRLSVGHKILVKGAISKKVVADPDRLVQVITNLLTNAIKYSPLSKSIIIHLLRIKEYACIVVKDQGIGIDKAQQKKIFERFYRGADVDERLYPGMGVGLYISSEIIKRHGGRIWVESRKGNGSTFYFTVPLVKS